MNITELLGEATEYDKKQAVEMKKPKSWLKSISAFADGKLTNAGAILADNSPVRHSRFQN